MGSGKARRGWRIGGLGLRPDWFCWVTFASLRTDAFAWPSGATLVLLQERD